ncbi:MAG: NUDIX domain-containing protein [Candidatus Marsarchaeota archaeon]|nr:NUDIX domain-containing protein [Candidatus Marsarchaeota archaeon]MCL5413083.1 NUDIX domain-containing protein [Candidatus Marsarchaeota archaeon]
MELSEEGVGFPAHGVKCGSINAKGKYKLIERDGIFAIIVHNRKVLLLKRRNLPVVINPGIWSFLSGAREGKDRYLATAYREIEEESGIKKECLRLLYSGRINVIDLKKGFSWPNRLYLFRSSTGKVRLDYENAGYRWATLAQIEKEINYTNVFTNPKHIIKIIKGHING